MTMTTLHVRPNATAESNLFKPDTTLLDVESRNHLQLQLDAFQVVMDELAPTFKRLKLTPALTRFGKLCNDLKTDSKSIDVTISVLYARANAIAAEFHNHPAVQKHYSQKAEAEKSAEEGDFMVKTIAEYTYLLKTDGKLMILTDNLKKAEITGAALHGAAYTQLRYSDALIEMANVPYTTISEATGKETKGNVLKAWNESRLRRDLVGITFDPSSTERIVDNQYNTWRGWVVEPKEGDDLPFWELVLDVICDGNLEYFDFVRKYIAHMIQRPNERPLCALGISGPQGYGKSAFVTLLGALMHQSHYNPNVPMRAIAGEQQGRDLEGVLLAYLDEASWGGDKLSTGALKKAITGTSDRINEKFVPAYNIPTFKRIIFSSNDSYYYHADADDRRLLPLEVSYEKPKKSNEFFSRLFDKDGVPHPELLSAILYTLQHTPIDDFIPHQALQRLNIVTGASMLERSMTNVQRWLYDSINNGAFELPGLEKGDDPRSIVDGCISINELKESYAHACSFSSLDKNRTVNLSSHESSAILKKTFGHDSKPMKRAGNVARRYAIDWAVMRENFTAQFKWNIKWDDFLTEEDALHVQGIVLQRSLKRA